MFDDVEVVRLRLVVMRELATAKALHAEIVVVADTLGASDSYLRPASQPALQLHTSRGLTVEVISAEQTSQTYLTPPSPPRTAFFFLITPILQLQYGCAPGPNNASIWKTRRCGSKMRFRKPWSRLAADLSPVGEAVYPIAGLGHRIPRTLVVYHGLSERLTVLIEILWLKHVKLFPTL